MWIRKAAWRLLTRHLLVVIIPIEQLYYVRGLSIAVLDMDSDQQMAEIIKIPKRSRPYQRPPLLEPTAAGADLRERLDLPRYEPPKPKPKQPPARRRSSSPQYQTPVQCPINNPVERPPVVLSSADSAPNLPQEHPLADSAQRPLAASVPVSSLPAAAAEHVVKPRFVAAPRPTISLSLLLADCQDLPQQTAILGICDDGLPMLLDLKDPSPGSLLVVGDERQQQLDLLRTAVSSVVLRNSPRGVQFIVFSHLPDAWQDWVSGQGFDRYCMGVVGVDTPAAREWILRLTEWAEQRRMGERSGPPVLILLDTLNFIPKLSYDLRMKFELLVKEGPQEGVWPVAAISIALANSLARQVNIFQTLIFGYSEDPTFYTRVGGVEEGMAKNFGEPGVFAVKVGAEENEDWLKFRLPVLD